MAAKQKKNKSSCPFWHSQSSSCMKCKGGLLIPLDDHVDVYCTAPDFSGCLQYSCQADNQMENPDGGVISLQNRRKLRRHTASHKISVTKLTGSSEAISQSSTVAIALDVSEEGMRLSTPVPFANGTALQFFIHDPSTEDLQLGVGQVAWCNKYIDEPGYQAGVIFQGKSYAEAMGVYPGIHHEYM